jgi:hypothetical protein
MAAVSTRLAAERVILSMVLLLGDAGGATTPRPLADFLQSA